MQLVVRTKTKLPAILVINKDLHESIESYAGGIRELLILHRVPRSEWQNVWSELDKHKDADEDLDLQWFIGWFRGTADALGVSEAALVTL